MNKATIAFLILISVLLMSFAACGEMVQPSEKEDPGLSDLEPSFVINEKLLSRMNEKGYDSLTVYRHKIKT